MQTTTKPVSAVELMDLLIGTLQSIESTPIEVPIRPEVDYDDVVLIVGDDPNHLEVLTERVESYYRNASVAHLVRPPSVVEVASETFVSLLAQAVDLGRRVLLTEMGTLRPAAVKALKNAGYVVDHLSSIQDPSKSYVAIRTVKGLIVVHLDPTNNRAYSSALAWESEMETLINRPLQSAPSVTGVLDFLKSLFKK